MNTYRDYIKEKHAKFNTQDFLINEEVKKATGSEPVSKKKLMLGEVNEVYDIATKSGQQVIVRISRDKHNGLEKEEKGIELVKKVGVPVPEVLLVETVKSDDGRDLTFSIENKIEGVPMFDLIKISNIGKIKRLTIESGKILSQIHSVNFPEEKESWKDYILKVKLKREKIVNAARKANLKTELISRSLKIIEENGSFFDIKEKSLIHGDFGPEHFLVKDNHIVGVIDFENCRNGDPIFDFAWINFFYETKITLNWLIEGYKNKSIFDENFEKKLHLYKLYLGLDLLDYYVSENNQSGTDHTKERLEMELRYFDKMFHK